MVSVVSNNLKHIFQFKTSSAYLFFMIREQSV